MNLEILRKQIDKADEQIVKLFCGRMDICAKIAEYKRENGLPVYDPEREREKLVAAAENTPGALTDYITRLYKLIFELSRDYQNKITGSKNGADR